MKHTSRKADEVVGHHTATHFREVWECTVEQVAVNAVMAGARPEYFPVILAIAATGASARGSSTSSMASMVVVNGPVRTEIGMNAGTGAMGPYNQANATIGRAFGLLSQNLQGGSAPGDTYMGSMGNALAYASPTFAENEEASPFEPLHVQRGFAPTDSTVTLFSGEGPFTINDHLSRSASQLAASLGWSAAGIWNHKSFPLYGHTLFVIGPEHARTLGEERWSKQDFRRFLYDTIRRPARDLAPGPDGAETGRLKDLLDGLTGDERIPKFPSLEEIVIVVAGRRIVGGDVLGRNLSRCARVAAASLAMCAIAFASRPLGVLPSLALAGSSFVVLAVALRVARPEEVAYVSAQLRRLRRRGSARSSA